MTIQPTMPGLSLEEWRRVFSIHPWHFWGMENSLMPVTAQADDVLREEAWQSVDSVGRQEIVDAIRSAERKLFDQLNYRMWPQYAEATVPWPRTGDTRLRRTGAWDARGEWLSITLPEAQVQAIGVESLTLIGTPAVAYSDPDGDGLNELATVTVVTTVTDPAQIAVYFQASDRLNGAAVGDVWRVRPVTVSIAGGTATIRIPAWLLVRPLNYQGVATVDLDPATPGVLATAVEVYQRTTDQGGTTVATAGAVITWETRPYYGWWSIGAATTVPYGGSPYDPAAVAQAVGRVAIRDGPRGIVAPAQAAYDASTGTWASLSWAAGWEPDTATVRYLAGVPSPDGQQLDRGWRTIVARLAAAELGRPLCAKEPANKELARWQLDLARDAGNNDDRYQISQADLENPFGTRRGHVDAWQFITRNQRTPGIYAG